MNWYAFVGVTAITSFFFPVVVILYNRFYRHRSLAALLVYYILIAVYNLMDTKLIPSSEPFHQFLGLLDNYLDAPLMLTALVFFCPGKKKQRIVQILAGSFVGYELVITLIYGFNSKSAIYIMGPGIAIILIYSFYLFIRQIKFTIIHGKNTGRTLMLASILFAYGCFALIYYFYYIQRTRYVADTYLLYFISSFVASTLMGIGLHLMRKRIKELQSLKVLRKELALFFNNN
jgi:hypothetical protein